MGSHPLLHERTLVNRRWASIAKPIGIILALSTIVAAFVTFSNAINLSDEFNYQFAGNSSGLVIVAAMILAVVALILAVSIDQSSLKKSAGLRSLVSIATCFVLLAFSCATLAYANIKLHSFETDKSKQLELVQNLQSTPAFSCIELESLQTLKVEEYSGAVLIERKGCPYCEKEVPSLERYLSGKQIGILYYDTAGDRETRREFVLEVMNQYQIESVPTLIILDNGIVTEKITGPSLADKLDNYLYGAVKND